MVPLEGMVKPQAFAPVWGLAHGLICMGAEGVHPLFASEWIRRAFHRVDAGLFQHEQLLLAHQALKNLSRYRQIQRKRVYLESLPDSTVDMLVFLYFRSLDQFLETQAPTLH